MEPRLILVAVLAALVGAGGGWWLGQSQSPAPSLEAALDEVPTDADGGAARAVEGPALDSSGVALKASQAELEVELERRIAAEGTVAELRKALAVLQEDAAKGRLAGGKERTVGVRYANERFRKALEAVDWEEAGEALSRMVPLMGEYIQSQLDGKPPPPSVGDIQKYNGALVKLALTAQQQGMPGSGTNGAFTHISMTANLVLSTLAQAELPLDAAQEKRLVELADTLLEEDARRLAGYGDESFGLQKVLEETALKSRFYAGVDALATDEQRKALHPDAVRGRVQLDLFSSGLVWAGHLAPQRYRKPEELKARLIQQVLMRYGVEAEHKPIVEEAASEWLAAFPSGYLTEAPDTLSAKGHIMVARVRTAAEVQLAFFRRLVERLPADAPAAAKIRAEDSVAVPFKRE